ncbi:MAG: DUF3078 domain-containing protein [Syntrophothermus sp.]
MKKVTFLFIAICFCTGVSAQDTISKIVAKHEFVPDTVKPWLVSGMFTLNFNQAYFENWSAGGDNALGLNSLLNLKADYKKGKFSWMNNLDLAYGLQLNSVGSSEQQFRKTDDKIDLTTSFGYQIGPKWDLSFLANFKTQFSAGYKYPDDSTKISNFMAPGYLIAGIGFTYKPSPWFSLFLSPLSERLTFVLDKTLSDQGAFGVDSSKTIKNELGAYIRATLNKDITKSINITSTLDLYTNYLKDFGNIDVNWNLLIILKVNKFLATTINTQLIYDNDVQITDSNGKTGPRTQFRENIGVGISYKIH